VHYHPEGVAAFSPFGVWRYTVFPEERCCINIGFTAQGWTVCKGFRQLAYRGASSTEHGATCIRE